MFDGMILPYASRFGQVGATFPLVDPFWWGCGGGEAAAHPHQKERSGGAERSSRSLLQRDYLSRFDITQHASLDRYLAWCTYALRFTSAASDRGLISPIAAATPSSTAEARRPSARPPGVSAIMPVSVGPSN